MSSNVQESPAQAHDIAKGINTPEHIYYIQEQDDGISDAKPGWRKRLLPDDY